MSEFTSYVPPEAEKWRKERPELVDQLKGEVIKEILEKDQMIDDILENPEISSYTTIDYLLPEMEGRELKSGQRLAFVIPEEFRDRIVRDVILLHRKGEKGRELIGSDRRDPHGAYSRVELHDQNSSQWLGWQDPKGYSPDKFAEPRPASDPEHEVLHDWLATVGEVKPDALRVTNVGQHPEYSAARIHGVEIIFFPELESVDYQERIYCPGTSFIDIEKGHKLPTYGGGSQTEGIYKGAMVLNQHKEALYELAKNPGENAEIQGSRITIDLEAGKSLVQAEVAIGDTEHLDYINPKTGRKTRLGYAKLWVGIERDESGKVDWFIQNANVPPQGVIAGAPHLEESLINPGDKLVIESRQDTAFLMGWRLAYK